MKQKVLTHIGIVLLFLIVACAYFSPALSGKVIRQGDIQKSEAMAYEQKQVENQLGEIPNWNSSMFSGMPGYQTAVEPQHSIFTPLKSILIMRPFGAERHIGVLFLYLIGFYIALIALGINPWLSLMGALAFGLGSYNIIIIEAGHITKAWAMSMIAPILAGMVLTLRGFKTYKKEDKSGLGMIIWGAILFTLSLGVQITFNHIQITFYTALAGVILGIVYLIYALKEKWILGLVKAMAVLLVGCAFALACNARHLVVNQEYSKQTMRGGSELTKSTGLEQEYAFSWSYGVGETYTILVPGSYGGGSGEKVSHESESYKNFHQDRMPLYWGDQPFTSGPVYFGSIVIFLFVLGLLMVKGPEKWWLLCATILAIMMSWGRNFEAFNSILFDKLPLYNKFRTPSMSLVLANVTMIILAMLGLKEFVDPKIETRKKMNSLYWSVGISGGIILIMLLMKNSLSFSGASDTQMAASYGPQWGRIQEVFIQDRKALFTRDSWRSLLFILISAAALWLYGKEKLSKKVLLYSILAILVVVDLWGVDRRYLNDENFTNKHALDITPDAYDLAIDQYAEQFGDVDYRVFNVAVNTFNDSKPSAFHHQIGGYSAAKLRRYQDLIDYYMSSEINPQVLNMLNGRYFVLRDGSVQRNPEALGNAWFVKDVKFVDGSQAEIEALRDFNPSAEAIVDDSWKAKIGEIKSCFDSTATIEMVHDKIYNPDHLTYNSKSNSDQIAVFSEIYYEPDWKAYIDGKSADYFRANYVLRAMIIPAGTHTIEFVNEAPTLHKWDNITLWCSILLLVLISGSITYWCIAARKE